jgi:nitroreductase
VEPHDLAALIRRRRSNLQIDPTTVVSRDILHELCDAVMWAPNHKRTWPARIAIMSGESRHALGNTIANVMAAQNENEAKVQKTRSKYLRAPHIIVIGAVRGDSDQRTRENQYAVAAGVQNLLLTAEAHDLAALWGSPADGANAALNTLCSFDDDVDVIGLVYVGHPNGTVEQPARPATPLAWFD